MMIKDPATPDTQKPVTEVPDIFLHCPCQKTKLNQISFQGRLMNYSDNKCKEMPQSEIQSQLKDTLQYVSTARKYSLLL